MICRPSSRTTVRNLALASPFSYFCCPDSPSVRNNVGEIVSTPGRKCILRRISHAFEVLLLQSLPATRRGYHLRVSQTKTKFTRAHRVTIETYSTYLQSNCRTPAINSATCLALIDASLSATKIEFQLPVLSRSVSSLVNYIVEQLADPVNFNTPKKGGQAFRCPVCKCYDIYFGTKSLRKPEANVSVLRLTV